MTLVLADWLLVAADRPAERGWGVRVDGSVIAEIGPAADLRAAHPDDDIVDASGHLVMPGFVNAHVHLYGTLAHGIPPADGAGPTDFWSFLEDYWWPKVEDALDVPMIEAATDYVCAEMLRSGTTTFYDILEAPHALPDALLAQKEVLERRGMRGLLSFEATERAGAEIARLGLEENVRLIDACDADGLVGGLMCWHTTFTCSADYITPRSAASPNASVM